MKPSERIEQIRKEEYNKAIEYNLKNPVTVKNCKHEVSMYAMKDPLIMYLDEEYEKKQPQQDKLLDLIKTMEKEILNKWVYRLQDYIKAVNQSRNPEAEKIAIVRLLGYLSSLESIIN